jgi:gamma-glutamyltranspeptidase/glutathione hydrolase
VTYRGYTVYETPPPTQGLAALLTLNLLEGFDLTRHEIHSPEHLHLLIEMTKLAYADRNRWIADPAHERVPVEALLSKRFAEKRRRAFDPARAQDHRWARSTATPPACGG